MSWENAVKKCIAAEAKQAYEKANRGRKRYVPYVLPEIAEHMLAALNDGDEAEGKRLMHIWRCGALSLA